MVNDAFIELLTKKLSDELNAGEQVMFNDLLKSDEDFRKQYEFFKSYWVQEQEKYSNSNAMFENILTKITILEPAEVAIKEEPKYRRFYFFLKTIAAVLVAGVSCAALFYAANLNEKANTTAKLDLTATPSRMKSKITLSDGSVVTLNSETTLKYPLSFTGKTREVYLNGEAYFDVAKDHKHPFIVHTGQMRVKVLGTAFNIKSYPNDVTSETTLIRGAIEVTLTDRPSDRIILKPNEKLILKSTHLIKHRVRTPLAKAKMDSINTSYSLTNLTYFKTNDTTVVETSWVNNKLIFKDEPFEALARKMERWYGVKIKFKNDRAQDYHFTGVFEKETMLQAFKALQMIEPFDYKLKNGTAYITDPINLN
ncbi:FecR family protein [Mucilaginibacter glaciei]|uniref:FecR family protein n=1 Tax=Mucilaginibacter glaciei TaxID=2772109 RepID=A0A926NQ74_9SPHI|nr:FecR family protein [Mucilaginibacter glaciei]MBD1393378.1 FecR family protein [Mucilaginibacter glaciei]